MIAFKDFTFDAAHFLPNVPSSHKCHNLHGHTYHVRVSVEGRVDQRMGWVIDYAEIAAAWEPIAKELDHHVLNEIPGLENSTCENLARWIWDRLERTIPIALIEIKETDTAGVKYAGD